MPVTLRAQALRYPTSFLPPSTTQGVINAIPQYVRYSFDGDYTLFVQGPSEPAPTDQNKVWFQTDAVGRPVAIKRYYNGRWRRVYLGKPYHVSMYSGPWTQFFDPTGLGFATLDWEGWALCNGANGTLDLTNKFIVPGYRCDGAYRWVTNVTGADAYSGGSATRTITLAHLPAVTLSLNYAPIFGAGNVRYSVLPANQASPGNSENYVADGTGANKDFPTVPPFIALGFAQWVGYSS